jgi:GT2 family glycosyltransferase
MPSGEELCGNADKMLALGSGADVIYADEVIGGREFYKPDYSPHTLDSFDYIGAAFVKKSAVVDGDTTFSDSYELYKSLSHRGCGFYHYKALAFKSDRVPAESVESFASDGGKVSIIIPSKDNPKCLRDCIRSVREHSTGDYEIIVTDNGSSAENAEIYKALCDKYIYQKREFNFSAMCNMGAEAAEGKYLIFLNDDIVINDARWLEKLTSKAGLENAGAVGAKLLYPSEDRIQHCGVISIANGPVHAFIGARSGEDCYFGRNRLTYNYLAVTAACLCIRRDIFPRFNEELRVAYNDVELCFRLYKGGYYNMVVNDISIYHYESYSRGNDLADKNKLKRLAAEREKLYKLYPEFKKYDPFYNPELSQLRADFKKRRWYDWVIEAVRRG